MSRQLEEMLVMARFWTEYHQTAHEKKPFFHIWLFDGKGSSRPLHFCKN